MIVANAQVSAPGRTSKQSKTPTIEVESSDENVRTRITAFSKVSADTAERCFPKVAHPTPYLQQLSSVNNCSSLKGMTLLAK